MKQYDPFNWYWRAEDGRLYSSKLNELIKPDEEAFVQHVDGGGYATPWPRDNDGMQTTAALQEVLAPFDIVIGELTAPA